MFTKCISGVTKRWAPKSLCYLNIIFITFLDSTELAESRQSFRESLEDVRSDTKVDCKWFLKGAKDSQG